MALDDTPRLGCGRSIDGVWTGLDQPPTWHEEHCAQCQKAKAQLQQLQKATLLLVESDLHDLELIPSTSMTSAIMDVARAEVRRGSRLKLSTTHNGTIEMSEQALCSLIRLAATGIAGIHARRCRVEVRATTEGVAEPGDTQTSGPQLVINLRVAVAAGIDIPRTVEALRQEIRTALPTGVGVDAGTINITVEDLYDV